MFGRYRLPYGIGSQILNPLKSFSGFKIADKLLLASDYGCIIIGSLRLPNVYTDVICDLLQLMSRLSRKSIRRADLAEVDTELSRTMEKLNTLLPKFARTYCFHALHHQSRQVELAGPRFAHSTLYGERFVRYLLRIMPESRRGQQVLSNKLTAWMSSFVRNEVNEDGSLKTVYTPLDGLKSSNAWMLPRRRANGDHVEADLHEDQGSHYYGMFGSNEAAPPNPDDIMRCEEVGAWRIIQPGDNDPVVEKMRTHFTEVLERKRRQRRRGPGGGPIQSSLPMPDETWQFEYRRGHRLAINNRVRYRTEERDKRHNDTMRAKGHRGRTWFQ